MIPLYAPSIVLRDLKGRAIAIQPLKPVEAPGCPRWNRMRKSVERAA